MIQRLRGLFGLCGLFAMLAMGSLLTGCASTVQSDVIAFHNWSAAPADKTFSFARTPDQNASLEYRSYEDMVRNELSRLGYIPDTENRSTALAVALSYEVRTSQIVVNQPYDPFWYGPGFYPGWGWRQGGYGYYDPFFSPPMQQTVYPIYTRRMHVLITGVADKQPLYEVEVVSEGRDSGLSNVMPYMIRSAFTDFPGQSGVMHRVKLKTN